MRLLYILLVFLIWDAANAQITFNKRFNAGFPFQNVTEILPTDSCYYLIGVFTDSVGGVQTVGTFLTKLNTEGEIHWQKTIGSPSKYYETWGSGLHTVGDTSLVTMGITKDSTAKVVVIRYDLNGDTLFTKEYFSPFYPEEPFISADQDIIPYKNGFSLLSGVDSEPASANAEIYWMRLNEVGQVIETAIFLSPLQDTPETQVIDEYGNITIGAFSHNIGQVNQNFTCQAQILQIDSLGNQKWLYKTPANQLFSSARSLLPTPDGGLIVGTGKGVETAINSSSGRVDWNPCFFKLNADRQMEWAREFRGRTMGPIYAIVKIAQATDSSGYLGVSRIADFESAEEPLNGMWVMKVSNAGDSLWARHFTLIDEEPGMPEPMDLKATPDGGYIVCGAIDPPDDGGVHPLRYGWLLKLDEHGCLVPGCHLPNSTTQEPDLQPQLALFPNPARDFINFELRGARTDHDGAFRILDAQGRLLRSIPAQKALGTVVIPVHDWAAGAYVVQYLEGGQARAAERFLKVE
ncbi:MAG: T9SS type A sorting domain-containing protein [Phaeodactylibacter sp.]|nr:T9SS type A sorting domain-containing protein [Phaeodactylibacter sp.]